MHRRRDLGGASVGMTILSAGNLELMLDLGFVRTNLELVERKLRERGADPAELLGDFRELDQERRANITRLENLRAQYNIA
ncbi:MAG: hypothetical protein WA374_00585, partial [Acidobacteriaceae bacterium]